MEITMEYIRQKQTVGQTDLLMLMIFAQKIRTDENEACAQMFSAAEATAIRGRLA